MLKTFDLRRVLTALETTGATSVPLLTESAEQALLQEALHYQYHRWRKGLNIRFGSKSDP